jgi:alkylhydroperoxidase family enzyme
VSHAGFLRERWDGDDDDWRALMAALTAFADGVPDLPPRRAPDAFESLDLPLSAADRAMVDLAARLTLFPSSTRPVHLERLRDHGFDDHALHDVVAVASCFAYMNRLADGLGVALEAPKTTNALDIYGEDGVAAHEAWAAAHPDER